MNHYFNLVGHPVPNGNDELHIEAQQFREVWKEYKEDLVIYFKEDEHSILSYSAFIKLWITAFPDVKIRMYKQVAGKCSTCAKLSAFRQKRKDNFGRKQYSELLALHRSMFTGERCSYYDRRHEAVMLPLNCSSYNTDGMNQLNSKVPYMANLQDFPRPLGQHIQGVLDHGHEFVVYRSFSNVKHDANLAVHCLLLQLEAQIQRNKSGMYCYDQN